MENVLNDTVRPALSTQALSIAEFDEVVRTHQRRVYRVLVLLVRDLDEADTLTQECFLRAYQSLSRFRGECSVQTWLLRIAINLAKDYARNRRARFWKQLVGLSTDDNQRQTLEFACPNPTPEKALLVRAEVQAVWEAARSLSQQQRTIFALRFVEELELNEIAEILGLQVGSVKTHLFRAVHAIN